MSTPADPVPSLTEQQWQWLLVAMISSAFSPCSSPRARCRRGKGNKANASGLEDATPVEHQVSLIPDRVRFRLWARRLKPVFNIDIETCSQYVGAMKVIACIEEPVVIKTILTHLKGESEFKAPKPLPESRAPPQYFLFE